MQDHINQFFTQFNIFDASSKEKCCCTFRDQEHDGCQQQALEEQKRLEEEEQRRLEEEDCRAKEQERLEEEARQAKKGRDQQTKEELRRQGKPISKSEREKRERNRLKLQQLIESSLVKIPIKEEIDSQAPAGKKKPIYGSKKCKKTRADKYEDRSGAPKEDKEDNWESHFGSPSDGEPSDGGLRESLQQLAIEDQVRTPGATLEAPQRSG